MNSIMPIAATHITPQDCEEMSLAMALDAGASRPSDNRRMHRPRGQDHAVSGLQLEAAALAFEHEGDRSIDAVKDLLVAVAVSRVAVARAVRPRVAAGGLGFELRHQLVECRHIAILRLLGGVDAFSPTATLSRLRVGFARWAAT